MNVVIVTMSFIGAIVSFAPSLNAELDFGPELTVMGTIHEIEYDVSFVLGSPGSSAYRGSRSSAILNLTDQSN
ncbi:hypothetical protein MYIN104542_21940 [Mycobacterium intermedium]